MKKIAKYLLRGVMLLFGALPLSVHHFNARWIAYLMRNIARYRNDEVMINLSRSFPEKDYAALKAIRDEYYLHLADVFVEALWFGARTMDQLHRSAVVRIKNPEEIQRLKTVSESVIVMCTHCGNWEILGGIEAYDYSGNTPLMTEKTYCISYLAQPGQVWDEVLSDNRKGPLHSPKTYDGYMESHQALRFMMRHCGEHRYFCMITDQRPYFNSPDYMHVEFLHQDCVTMYGAASVACKLSLPVVYQKMTVAGRGKYELEYITICDNASTMSREAIMKRYYELLEEQIRQQPFNYLWTHRRWQKI